MKAAVIYWSGTGNTEQMANAIAEGAGAELFSVSDFTGDIADYDRIAFGCSAMGDEVLEESEFEPFFTAIEGALSGKAIALFGSSSHKKRLQSKYKKAARMGNHTGCFCT